MPVRFFSESIHFNLKNKRAVTAWIKQVIECNDRKPGHINIIFCDDNYLLQINQKFLRHNTFTDVVTFQYHEQKSEPVTGDIFISIDRVRENAEELQKVFDNELHRVIIHGILHLCDYKDKSPAQKKKMKEAEDRYLNMLYASLQ